MAFQAPNSSTYIKKRVPQGKNPRATNGRRRKQTSSTTKHNPGSKLEGPNYVEKEINFTEDEFNSSLDLSSSDDIKKEIKMEDLSKLIPNVEVDFMDLDSPEDDEPSLFKMK
uniref:Uncharacterized protein n=1 Tax=Tanacetum cinerariifolium TaxID=118510 RepID=A0A6L2NME6_TANCI|nr:hypothetical protein [Tanacetum cinerariifolium]